MRAYWLFPIFSILSTSCYAENAPKTLVHEFHIQETGGFLVKILKELGTPEAVAMVSAACAAYEGDCSQEAGAGGMAAKVLSAQEISHGGNYYITGKLTKPHAGEEWWGLFDQLEGYQVCKATLISKSLSEGSTFNTVVYRSGPYQGLGFYAEVPKGRPQPHKIDAVFSIYYVPTGTTAKYNCSADGSPAWLLRG
jgi:hypothetical protein